MRRERADSHGIIAAERQRRIFERALRDGTVNVYDLAAEMNVTASTIRRDLTKLDRLGKLTRSHGGAAVRERLIGVPDYAETRETHQREKAWIGAAAVKHIPQVGTIFINGGTTTHQLALRLPENPRLQVVTTSLAIASECGLSKGLETHILGGRINREAGQTDCIWSADALEKLYWDVCFLGIEALDASRGITSSFLDSMHESKVTEHCKRVIVLADASKLGRVAALAICPLSKVDLVIVDSGADVAFIEEIRAQGVEVEIAGKEETNDGEV